MGILRDMWVGTESEYFLKFIPSSYLGMGSRDQGKRRGINLRFGVLELLPWSGWILTLRFLHACPAPHMGIDVVSLALQCSPSCSLKTETESVL